VVRKPLEREQAESGRATGIIRFEPEDREKVVVNTHPAP
jgi:hypothetical protein